jgi:hypothetical protein
MKTYYKLVILFVNIVFTKNNKEMTEFEFGIKKEEKRKE